MAWFLVGRRSSWGGVVCSKGAVVNPSPKEKNGVGPGKAQNHLRPEGSWNCFVVVNGVVSFMVIMTVVMMTNGNSVATCSHPGSL